MFIYLISGTFISYQLILGRPMDNFTCFSRHLWCSKQFLKTIGKQITIVDWHSHSHLCLGVELYNRYVFSLSAFYQHIVKLLIPGTGGIVKAGFHGDRCCEQCFQLSGATLSISGLSILLLTAKFAFQMKKSPNYFSF